MTTTTDTDTSTTVVLDVDLDLEPICGHGTTTTPPTPCTHTATHLGRWLHQVNGQLCTTILLCNCHTTYYLRMTQVVTVVCDQHRTTNVLDVVPL